MARDMMNRKAKDMGGDNALIMAIKAKPSKEEMMPEGEEMMGGGMELTWPISKTPELKGKKEGDEVELKAVPLDVTATVKSVEGGNATISVNNLAYAEEGEVEGEGEEYVEPELPEEENKRNAESLVGMFKKKSA